MKYKQKFGAPGTVLALNPKALDILFETTQVKENCVEDGIAIVSICGPLEHHFSWMFDSYDAIIERMEAAFSDPDSVAVVMCIDSPGGDAAGSTEAHRRIQSLKKKYKKPLYAYSNEAMYSAAYSLGSAADEVWVPETGGVGSVGVICSLLDKTEQNEQLGLDIRLLTTGARKADTHADRKLTDDVIDAMQSRVDYLGDVFFRCVAKARSMSPKAVKGLEAGVFMGQEAVAAGLADGIAGWYSFISGVRSKIFGGKNSKDDDSVQEQSKMKTLSQLKKARAEAAKKLLNAKSGDERKKLLAAYDTASTELAEFQAKTKYVKKTEERLTEEDDKDDDDEDDDSDEDAEEEESEEEESEEEESDEDAEEEESEEEESEEEEKKSKHKMKKVTDLSLKALDRLFKVAAKVTGKSDVSEICGSLEGMSQRTSKSKNVEATLAKLVLKDKKTRVKEMLDLAQKEGRVTPAQAKGLFEQGLKDPKWLKGYLSSQPKQTRDLAIPDVDGLPESIESMSLTRDQEKMLQQAAASAGMNVEQYKEHINKFSKNKSNGSLPRT